MLSSLAEKVAPGRAALVVIDIQNDFLAAGGVFDRIGRDVVPLQQIVPRIAGLVEAAHHEGVPVVFVRYVQSPWTESDVQLEQRKRGRANERVCGEGTWGAEFFQLAPGDRDVVVTKHRYSAFINTDLDVFLRSRHIETIVLVGVATNGCVEATARDAFMNDYYVVVVDDACGTFSAPAHAASLDNIRDAYGVVCDAADLKVKWMGASGLAASAAGDNRGS